MSDYLPAELSGRIAIITGGISGIGAATATLLASRGVKIMLISELDPKESVELRKQIAAAGGHAESYQCDVTDTKRIDETVAAILAQHGRIDILINSAGVFLMRSLEETSPEDVERVMSVDFYGTYNMIRAVLPAMRSAKIGAIVNVASLAAVQSSGLSTAYAASKGAVVTLTRCLVPELARSGIRINTVMPGPVRTPMIKSFYAPTDDPGRAFLAKMTEMSPSPHGRVVIEPEDVAEVILFLVSDAAKAIQGTSIPVADGLGEALPF